MMFRVDLIIKQNKGVGRDRLTKSTGVGQSDSLKPKPEVLLGQWSFIVWSAALRSGVANGCERREV